MGGMKFRLMLQLVAVSCVLLNTAISLDDLHFKVNDPVRYLHSRHPLTAHRATSLKGSDHEAEEAIDETPLAIDEAPLVTAGVLGPIRGRVLTTFFDRPFSAFHSIRYAAQPARFSYSELYEEPLTSDGSDYDATAFRDRCPQKSLVAPVIAGSEDCLHVSVYSPLNNFSDAESAALPVMFFIHGGAYMSGDATLYMPSKLLDKDVVVAVVQYRLGTLGFLYSGTEDAPGNMGLHDQIVALRWVQKFISYFGGNPNLVTVFGQSAGGASTSLLQLSPLLAAEQNNGKALAHRFAPMSGSALEYWTIEHDPYNSFRTQVAETGCSTNATEAEMVACMVELPLDDVVWASLRVYSKDRRNGGLGFIGQVPVVQTEVSDVDGLEIVIPEQPIDLLKSGRYLHVPTMTGSVRDEGSLVAGLMYEGYMLPNNHTTDDAEFLKNDMFPLIAIAFGINDVTNAAPNSFRLGFMPKDVPLGDWDTMVGGIVDLSGMMFLKSGMWTLAHEMKKVNDDDGVTAEAPIFFYSFEFESKNSLFDWIFISDNDIPIEGGVCHADDLLYLFDLPALLNTEREKNMVRRHTTFFTNFAKYGNPTPEEESGNPGQWTEFTPKWEAFTIDEEQFLMISDNMSLLYDFVTRWNYNQYGYNTTKAADHHALALAMAAKSPQNSAASPTSDGQGYKVATGVMSVVAACCVLALLATVAWQRRREAKLRNSLLGEPTTHDNVALEPRI